MEKKKFSTKELIINAVISLQNENLFSKISLSHIAEKVGISKAAIFRHFKNKQDLMAETEAYVFDTIAELLLDVQNQINEKNPTTEKMLSSVCRVVSYFMENSAYFLYLLKFAIASHDFEARFIIEMRKRGVVELFTFYSSIDETGKIHIFDKKLYVKYIYAFCRVALFYEKVLMIPVLTKHTQKMWKILQPLFLMDSAIKKCPFQNSGVKIWTKSVK